MLTTILRNRLFLLAVALLCAGGTKAQVVINEIMQSNIDCMMDDMNEFPDSWVELYNAGSEPVDLSGYKLGVEEDAAAAWQLPSLALAPNAYQIVYCDKASKDWHTDFRLESGKDCMLFLFCDGAVADRLPDDMKKQPAPNIAFGRKTDGASEWGYQLKATPAEANCGATCNRGDLLGEPLFSTPGRVFRKGGRITLELSLPEGAPARTEIRYTDDGSEPNSQSKLYTGALSITGTKIVRAKLFCEGWLSPRSTTQSYIMMDREVTLPVVSVVSDRKYFYDSKIGIYVSGSYGGGKRNYEYNWRRPVNIEYFEDEGSGSALNQLCEARVGGAASRGQALKSLCFYAHKRFGQKRFKYEFFPDQRPGVDDFKSFMLRNAGNDFDGLYLRDALIQRLTAENTDVDWQAWSPAIFFLNGEYKGMLNIRERSNEDNVYTHYDGLEDVDMVENWWLVKEGTAEAWNSFNAFYTEHGHTWEEFEEVLDVQEFMDVMIVNIFFNNLDFPGNNMLLWRPRTDGGRWRVMMKDADYCMGIYNIPATYQYLQWLYTPNFDSNHNWGANSSLATRLFRRLMEDERFYREFTDRFVIYMGDFLNYSRTWELWEQMYDKIKYEYKFHHDLINRWWPNYDQEMTKAQKWVKDRGAIMYSQLLDQYGLGALKPLTINQPLRDEEVEGMSVTMNGVQLSRPRFNGKYFADRSVSITGENVDAWEVTEIYSNGPQKTEVPGNALTFTMPANCSAMTITAKTGLNGVDEIRQEPQNSACYNVLGQRVSPTAKGLKIQNGKKFMGER